MLERSSEQNGQKLLHTWSLKGLHCNGGLSIQMVQVMRPGEIPKVDVKRKEERSRD